jgi:uncharacterized membrane protein YkvA (DUF1232 family)
MSRRLEALRGRARQLKRETYALWFAYRDPRLPWYARLWTAFVVLHTFSPIDLIPDFIPVLGYLDDLIITPLGIALALKMIPPEVMAEARRRADTAITEEKPHRWLYALPVIAVWLFVLLAAGLALWRLFEGG